MHYFNLHDFITYAIIVLFVYGWYLCFFDQQYIDAEGNPISKKDWKKQKQMDTIYH